MEDLGLPLAFGKPQQQPQHQPQQKEEAQPHGLPPKPESRAEPGQRGPRGIVGGSKRRRGRGFAATGANAERVQTQDDNSSTELNAGVKRDRTGETGARQGGHRGGGHGPQRSAEDSEGYFQESYCEDPWRDLYPMLKS